MICKYKVDWTPKKSSSLVISGQCTPILPLTGWNICRRPKHRDVR
jgi:hypothetical protein